jgi:DNA-directed RNA polymerase subunit D
MKISILEQDSDSISFILSDVSIAFANAIRRIMIAEVPTMAIEDVMIFENTSVMFDEVLSHRLGLIPLKTDLKSYSTPEECDCESELGCNKCRASFTLDVDAGEESRVVYSGDLKPDDPDIKPASEKILIVKLAPGQKLKFEAYAKLGKGSHHAKYQPVSASTYRFNPIVKVDLKKCDGCGECVKFCPRNVFAIENSRLVVKNEINCTLCNECIRHCPIEPSPIKISWDDRSFIFYVESTGSLSAKEIINEAVNILQKKAELVIEHTKKMK